MNKQIRILKNEYYDSVTLMSLNATLKDELNAEEIVVLMATDMNKEMIEAVGLSNDEVIQASINDCIIGVITEEDASTLIDVIVEKLNNNTKKNETKDRIYKSIDSAVKNADTEFNMAVISVPGLYAAREANKALDNNLHVMLFSDNITIEEELQLKRKAKEKGLLLMGPDCGTAIINGTGLCFANNVRRGSIGLVAASGTGLQEVTVIIDRFGQGISQAIGVGGRDLSKDIGGIMMMESIKTLEKDPDTKVIVLISKPPANEVKEKIMGVLTTVTKDVVVCFIDGQDVSEQPNIYFESSLAGAAKKAIELLGGTSTNIVDLSDEQMELLLQKREQSNLMQRYVRGLYCGGTLCAEALSLARNELVSVNSNVAKKPEEKMKDVFRSTYNAFVDLGDDVFTNGKPHPMIEPTIRLERIIQEAQDPETAVILLDFELGYGSHNDPVGVTIKTIQKAKEIAEQDHREIVFIGYILGTDKDKQNYAKQLQLLEENGIIVAQSNAQAVQMAITLVKGCDGYGN